MRYAVLAAVAFVGVSLSAGAQRGGARGGSGGGHAVSGYRGGFSGHAGPAFRGGRSYGPSFAAGPRFASRPVTGRYGVNGLRPTGPRYGAAPSVARPAFYSRGGAYGTHNGPGERGRRDRGVFYPGYGYSGLVSYGSVYPFFSPFGEYPYDPLAYTPDDADTGTAQVADGEDSGYPTPWVDGGAPPTAAMQPYPYPQSQAAPAPEAASALPEEDAVTIVFKGGRPPEQIRNYALTRTALVIPGRHIREIPLDEVDLPATEKVNQEAGVDFQVPTAR